MLYGAPAMAQEAATPPATTNAGQNNGNATAQTASKKYQPLTREQKLKFGLTQAFWTPSAYLSPAVNAFFVERSEVKRPGKSADDKFADGASRYARVFATRSTAEFLGSGLYPVLFKQDPRYKRSDRVEFWPRLFHAASRAVVTQGDNGKTQVNISRMGGNLTAAALANIYERDVVRSRDAFGSPTSFRRRVGFEPTMTNFGVSTGLDALSYILFDEFDVLHRLGKVFKR